ncbi:MAG: GtrA family protein [Caulobacteraceae bacterium]|nr:GtrA family protein [Caulobacteraceae bacterium]
MSVFGEARLALKHIAVSLAGFAVDAMLLWLGLAAGLEPAWARVGSLLVAMQVTFVLNGRHVFKGLDHGRLPAQWLAYMTANGFGNACNYWIFVTLVSLHWPVVSAPFPALSAAASCAWLINYLTARGLVFGPGWRRLTGRKTPAGPKKAGPCGPRSGPSPGSRERFPP